MQERGGVTDGTEHKADGINIGETTKRLPAAL